MNHDQDKDDESEGRTDKADGQHNSEKSRKLHIPGTYVF